MLEDARAPYLVLAHHRSGSNFLNDLLQAHPLLECINEPLSMHTPYFREHDLVPWSATDFDRRVLHAALAPHADLRNFLLDFKDFLLQSQRHRVIGFKETVLFGKLGWLKEFVPGLKLIFLKRDLRAIVSSILRSQLSELWQYEELVPAAFQRLYPDARAEPPPPRGDSAEVRAAQLAAMSVAVRYALAQREIRFFEHRSFNLEDIVLRPEPCLQLITEFLGVPPDGAQMEFLRHRQSESRGGRYSSFRSPEDTQHAWSWHLSPAQLHAIDEVARSTRAEPRAKPSHALHDELPHD